MLQFLLFSAGEDGQFRAAFLFHALAQAELYGHGIEREIAFLTVHSMLHLLGYDHVHNENEEKEMFSKQEEVLKLMGLEVKK